MQKSIAVLSACVVVLVNLKLSSKNRFQLVIILDSLKCCIHEQSDHEQVCAYVHLNSFIHLTQNIHTDIGITNRHANPMPHPFNQLHLRFGIWVSDCITNLDCNSNPFTQCDDKMKVFDAQRWAPIPLGLPGSTPGIHIRTVSVMTDSFYILTYFVHWHTHTQTYRFYDSISLVIKGGL